MNSEDVMNTEYSSDKKEKEMISEIEVYKSKLVDSEAELKSFRDENENLRKRLEEKEKELSETKQLNFTLSRKVSRETTRTAEDILDNMFK